MTVIKIPEVINSSPIDDWELEPKTGNFRHKVLEDLGIVRVTGLFNDLGLTKNKPNLDCFRFRRQVDVLSFFTDNLPFYTHNKQLELLNNKEASSYSFVKKRYEQIMNKYKESFQAK